jgi:hypothetical protein
MSSRQNPHTTTTCSRQPQSQPQWAAESGSGRGRRATRLTSRLPPARGSRDALPARRGDRRGGIPGRASARRENRARQGGDSPSSRHPRCRGRCSDAMHEGAGDVRCSHAVMRASAATQDGIGELHDAPLYQGTAVNPTWRWDGAARHGEERERDPSPGEGERARDDRPSVDRTAGVLPGRCYEAETPVDGPVTGRTLPAIEAARPTRSYGSALDQRAVGRGRRPVEVGAVPCVRPTLGAAFRTQAAPGVPR